MAASYSATLWRQMAEEARAVATQNMRDAESRRELLQIARGYDVLAKRAEAFGDQPSGAGEVPTA